MGAQGSPTVIVLTADDTAAKIRALVTALRTRTGRDDLAAIVEDGLTYQLGTVALGEFEELSSLGWLAGLPSLPCCATHDEDRIAAFVAGIEQIAATGRLPGGTSDADGPGGP